MKDNEFTIDFTNQDGDHNPFEAGESGGLLSQDEVDLLLGGGDEEIELHRSEEKTIEQEPLPTG